jgi:hypothetical protein
MEDCLPRLDNKKLHGLIGAGNGDLLQVPRMGSAGRNG